MRRHLPVLPPDFEDPKLPRGTFSHSQYGLYKKCGKAYWFRYIENLRMPSRGALFKGVVIHAGVEVALNKVKDEAWSPTGKDALSEVLSHVSDTFDAGKAEVATWDEGETEGLAKDRTLRGYAAYHHQSLPAIRPEKVEEPFAVRVGDVPTIGYIDLIDRVKEFDDAGDPGRLVVADLKYTSAVWSQDDIDKDPQFTLYALATNIEEVRVDNLVEYKAGPQFKQKQARRDAVSKAVLIEDYAEVTDFIKKGVFPMAPIDSWQCTPKWCEYYARCRGRRR